MRGVDSDFVSCFVLDSTIFFKDTLGFQEALANNKMVKVIRSTYLLF